jgi:spore germination protein GerM
VLEPADPEAGEASGAGRVFFIDDSTGDRVLRSVLRDVEAAPEPLLSALLAGPNDAELDAQLATAIPMTTELNSARRFGETVVIDLSPAILDLSGDEFLLATAQLVATATGINGVEQVRLRVDGERRQWPNGAGELQEGALTIYDFPGYVESAQPDYPPVPPGG